MTPEIETKPDSIPKGGGGGTSEPRDRDREDDDLGEVE